MNPDRWRRVEALYDAALNVEPDRRAGFLEENCAGDGALRRDVESLLAHDESTGRFLGVPQEHAALAAGTRVSHYEIEKKLGEGGMGVVFQARDTRLDRRVALKFVRGEFTERFEREARAVATLNHPHIAALYDVGQHEGSPYLVMELIDGKPLKGPRPVKEVVAYGIQIADALAAAHAAGIVHRDLKPGNILLTHEGQAKLLDFGLARRVRVKHDQESTLTMRGEIAGTPAYMSPEQAEGKPADARSDIFSFGLVLYQLLTGRPAFSGDSSAAILAAVLREEPPPLGEKVPQELRRIVRRCLRKDPAQRFQHAGDAKIEMEELREEASAATASPRKGRRALWVAGGVAVLALGTALLTTRFLLRAPEGNPIPMSLTSYPGVESAPSLSPDGNRVSFSWDGGKETDPAHIYVRQIGVGGTPVRLTASSEVECCPAWSPDDRWIAFLGLRNRVTTLLVSPSIGGPERTLAAIPGPGTFLSWTPDAKWIAFSLGDSADSLRSIWMISVETGERRRLTNFATRSSMAQEPLGDVFPSFSPDGRRLAFARQTVPWAVGLYALSLTRDFRPAGEASKLTERQYPSVLGITWTADNREIVYSAGGLRSQSLWRLPIARRAAPTRLPFAFPAAVMPAISRTQDRLVYVWWTFNRNIWRLNLGTGEKKALIGSTWDGNFPRYSPDGRKIVFSSNRSGDYEIWTCAADGEGCLQLTSFGGPMLGSPRWSPDSRSLVFDCVMSQDDIYIISADGGTPRNITNHPAADSTPSWSSDGRWIYFASDRTGRYETWKIPAGGGDAVQVTRSGGGWAFESPDGKYLYFKKGATGAPRSSLFRMKVEGGAEEQLLPTQSSWAVTAKGVYFVPVGKNEILFYDPATGRTSKLATHDKHPLNIDVSPDERYMVWSQTDRSAQDLMLVEGFR